MILDFDTIVDRKGTNSIKWDLYERFFPKKDLLPLWVADMDFRTPDFILNALRKRLDHEVLGYTGYCDCWFNAIENWLRLRFNWEPPKETITFIPGVVKGITFALRCLTEERDGILMMPPVYHPFFHVTERLGRKVVFSPLEEHNGTFSINWEDFEEKLQGCKVFLLCHPHNPGGRVWTREELQRIADLCDKTNTIVISDEIHADLTFAPYQHIPFATVSDTAARISISFMAPSKAFNCAGLASSYAIVVNQDLREKFYTFLSDLGLNEGNIFSYEGAVAAYTHGEEWLTAVKDYIVANIDFVEDYLQRNIPQIKMMRPQASFLIFLDCRELGMTPEELASFFMDKAHLALNTGASFGPGGEGYMRLNVGTSRCVLTKALEQLRDAVVSL